jgi:uncharacterized protein YukE
MGYGGAKASSTNINFSYELALTAARDLWSLAAESRNHQGRRAASATIARRVWLGPKHDQFEEKLRQENADATAVADGLQNTARAIARSWAEARGQQDRINFARYVDHELDKDGWFENFIEWFGNEDDYGDPPGNPEPPAPPDFRPTRAPMYAEYEYRY